MEESLANGLPEGRYLSAVGGLRPDKGGQTAAMLMRSRVISDVRGEPVDVLTFDPCRWYPQIRARLREAGQLTGGMRVRNLYEHYRDLGWGADAGTGAGLEPVRDLRADAVAMKGGTPWKTQYLDASGAPVLIDYQRVDGSVYLRVASYSPRTPESLMTPVTRVAPDGEIVGRYGRVHDLYERWISDLTHADRRTFLFMDSRFLVPIIVPSRSPSVYPLYVLHNCHLPYPRLWSTPPKPDYARLLDRASDLSAFVTLTERQLGDIVRVRGDTGNFGVVPNPVETPVTPGTAERDPLRVVMVGRLENQKRIEHAIAIWARVIRTVPEAHLDVYGSGSHRGQLTDLIDDLGLRRSVTLHGWDPAAREEFWTASASLLTSRYEAYPLVVLESMARGCPVVAYDVPYGPREQIEDRRDGCLVPDGDIASAARAVVRLLQNPALVAQLGAAARRAAGQHDRTRFVADWARVLHGVRQRSEAPGAAGSRVPDRPDRAAPHVINANRSRRRAPLTRQRIQAALTMRQHIASWVPHRPR
jgi:poly(glycerol-phosphate) alpha-glucosyltransferase